MPKINKQHLTSESRIVADRALDGFPLLSAFGPSSIGIAVLDRQMRFRAINERLAGYNGVPPEAHLGKSPESVIGKLARVVSECAERVFKTQKAITGLQLSGKLPRREAVGYWVEDFLPIRDQAGKVSHICVVVEDVTQYREVEQQLADLRTMTARQMGSMIGWSQAIHELSQELVMKPPSSRVNTGEIQKTVHRLQMSCRNLWVECVTGHGSHPATGKAPGILSLRQRTVIRLLAEGKSAKEIAALLDVSPRTIETHRGRIFKKLGMNTVAELTRYAIRTGLTDL